MAYAFDLAGTLEQAAKVADAVARGEATGESASSRARRLVIGGIGIAVIIIILTR